ncbi:MAG: NAD(P)/FAD-dependent oxidoreductase [Ekhidna sp.]|nr:NAD(P)/FAD-dependent oxidoreductase [Ekhidna sp.]
MTDKIGIVGAGLVGSLLGISLKQKGFDISLFEKRKDPRKTKIHEGRSINLALSRRGILALQAVNIFDKIEPLLIPMKGRMVHDVKGELTFQPYGNEGQHINSVSRGRLNQTLIEELEKSGVLINFEHKCERVNFEDSTLEFLHGKKEKFDAILGTDGAFSVVRKQMQQLDRFSFSQHYIDHGYKELNMPPLNDDFAMKPNYLHIWPRGSFMLIALPNQDKTFTCTLFFPFEGDISFNSLIDKDGILSFFDSYFPDVLSLIPDLEEQYQKNPASSLMTIKSCPWHKNRTLLLGDASHAIVPFYGQGMNAGFEDVRLFVEMAEKMNWEWQSIPPAFSSARKPDADAIAELALNNFIEMRDHVGEADFLKRKELEAKLQDAHPEEWIPLYSMVTFSDLSYSEALRLGKIQQKVLDGFLDEGSDKCSYDKIIDRFNTLKKRESNINFPSR